MKLDRFRSLSSAAPCWRQKLLWLVLAIYSVSVPAFAASVWGDAATDYERGNYAGVISRIRAAMSDSPGDEDMQALLIKSLLATGHNTEAQAAVAVALARNRESLPLHWLARQVALANGKTGEAAQQIEEIRRLYAGRPWAHRSAPDLVVFGRAALVLGADPKEVLDKVYGVAAKLAPSDVQVFLARGDLALEKHDYALAAKAFGDGLKVVPEDADLNYGLARSLAEGDRKPMMDAVEAALKRNPHHVPTLLLMAEQRIDEESYDDAGKVLDEVLKVNPTSPDAWALRAVLAHLHADALGEQEAREHALATWASNPRVDYLIGKKLAQKYRFAPAAAAQRSALAFAPDYLPAKDELASDLLRLGDETEGWKLAEAVHESDGYDVEAFNLSTLHETMEKYATLSNDDFVLRLSAPQAAIYGQRALDLLARAKAKLTAKYGVELARPTYVEIFADPKDFAVRTFGMPDVNGFLGVCFGRVVTANGPSTNGHAANWEAVLWHEFCHVVTLQLTENKMPRWLSEGISVYEEEQADPSWGQHLTPTYRTMLLGKELTPLSHMSAAFLAPKSGLHLQFAYYEASLIVEFLVSRNGVEKLRGVLQQLRAGNDINVALEREIAPMPVLEKEFTTFAHNRANQLAPGLEFDEPPPEALQPGGDEALDRWAAAHPKNYWALLGRSRSLTREKKWREAQEPLSVLLASYTEPSGDDSPLRMFAATQRELGDTAGERATLEKFAAADDTATDAYLRLMNVAADSKDWPTVQKNADRFLAVNPLLPAPWRFLARGAAGAGDVPAAIAADRTLLRLDPPNPSEIHFELANLLHQTGGNDEARRQVLVALEDAPRNRAALKLLLELEPPAAPLTPR